MKTHTINAMENGAIPQLTIVVNKMGFAFFLMLINSVNFTLSMMGTSSKVKLLQLELRHLYTLTLLVNQIILESNTQW